MNTVYVKVMDGKGQAVIPNALVYVFDLLSQGYSTNRTNKHGHAELLAQDGGLFALTAAAPGFLPECALVRPNDDSRHHILYLSLDPSTPVIDCTQD